MTLTVSNTCPALDANAIQKLAGYRGPCITMQVPDHHPGAPEGSHQAILRDLIHQARETRGAGLLGPVEELAHSPEIEAGGPGFVLFRSPDVMLRYSVPSPGSKRLVVGDHFFLAPFVTAAFAARDFFILGLSKKHVRFFEFADGTCRELPLPAGVPASLEIAGGYDQPDHDLQNRATVGSSAGSMHSMQFGMLTDREAAGRYLNQFFKLVDEGLKPVLRAKPLLLMGVREEVNAYRRAAGYPHILSRDVEGNMEHLSLAQISDHAASAALAHYYDLGAKVLADYAEMTDRTRTLNAATEIVQAASLGRVHRLCFRTGAEDVANEAVVETLRAGGEVFALPQDRMPAVNPLAAILRY